MKKPLFVLGIIATVIISCQPRNQNSETTSAPSKADSEKSSHPSYPKTFWNIPMGSKMDSVKKTLSGRGIPKPSQLNDTTLYYKIKDFGGYTAKSVFLSFKQDRLALCGVDFQLKENKSAWGVFSKIESDLIEKYGNPILSKREFTPPFSDHPDKPDWAIKTGHALIDDTWKFGPTSPVRMIVLSIQDAESIALIYSAPTYSEDVEKSIKNSNSEF